MNNLDQIFSWIKKRCAFRYQENANSQMISCLEDIETLMHKLRDCQIPKENLDKIIAKYYFDFEFDRAIGDEIDSSIGFTDKDRQILRHNIINIYKDIAQYIIFQTKEPNLHKINTDTNDILNNETEILNLISNHVST